MFALILLQSFFSQAQKDNVATAITGAVIGIIVAFGAFVVRKLNKLESGQQTTLENQQINGGKLDKLTVPHPRRATDERRVETGDLPDVPQMDVARPHDRPADAP